MPAYAAMRRRVRLRGAPVPRAYFERDGGWTHAQRDVCPRSPALVLSVIAAATAALLLVGGYGLLKLIPRAG